MGPEEQEKNSNGIAGKPLFPHVNANGNTLETLQAANAPVRTPEKTASIEDSIGNLHRDDELKTLRTYQSDIVDAVRHTETSVVKIALAEKKKQEGEEKIATTDTQKNFFFLWLSGILIFGGMLAFGLFWIVTHQPKETPVPKIEPGQIISTESTRTIVVETGKTPIKTMIADSGNIETGPLVRYVFTENNKEISAERFIELLKSDIPSWLTRALGEHYIVGLSSKGGGWKPFMIFKTQSYENAFSGMLKWETTMPQDLSDALSHSQGSTTALSTGFISNFQDHAVKNKDTRVLRTADGTTLLMYSFPDKETIVITTDEETLKELFSRLTTVKFVR